MIGFSIRGCRRVGARGADCPSCTSGRRRHWCGAVAVACPGVGAKTALLVYADGDVAAALHDVVTLDRAATEALVARLLPGLEVVRSRTATWGGTGRGGGPARDPALDA
jgi:hypothetical protein